MRLNRDARLHPLILAIGCGAIAALGSIALSPAIAQRLVTEEGAIAAHVCSSSTACLDEVNKGAGVGIIASGKGGGVTASSSGGNGAKGSTTAFSSTTSFAGVAGEDLATPNPSGTPFFNSGVSGTSKTGTGVSGSSTAGAGVQGLSAGASGVVGYTQNTISGIAPSGVFGEDISQTSLAQGVTGFSSTGIGVQGDQFEAGKFLNAAFLGLTFKSEINTYYPAAPPGGLFNSDIGEGVVAESAGSTAETLSAANFGGGPLIRAYAAKNEVMDLDNKGDLVLKGKLTQHGNPHAVLHTQSGKDVVLYSPIQAVATVEDMGEGRLTLGQAYVTLDPHFVDAIDHTRDYLVFITPQGDTPGLYVTEKSLTGFTVREHDGRSDVAFDYRIVAQPFEPQGPRLAPAMPMPAHGFARAVTTKRPTVLPGGAVLIQH